MKEIFDRRYPVTSFFLLVTTLVFLLMLVTTGGNFGQGGYIYFDLEPCMGQLFSSFLSRFGVSSLPFLFILVGNISLSI